MSSASVPAVYTWVIGDVVEKMNRKFAELGLDENVLTDLKTIWETKIRQMGIATFPPMEGAGSGAGNPYQRDLNYNPAAASEGVYLPHSNVVNASGYHIPQNDGASEQVHPANDEEENTTTRRLTRQEIDAIIIKNGLVPKRAGKTNSEKTTVPQLDGGDDDEEDEDEDEDGSELASDLDDDEDDENAPTDHLILCQYEKVSRIKNKWKCVLKDGVVNINGKDYLFSRANGDFEW